MKILLVSTHFPPDPAGGSPESVRLTALALRQAGHHVTVVTPAWSPGVAPAGPYRVVQVPISGLYDHGSERRFLNPRYHAAFGAAIAALAPEADVIHAQDRRAILATWLGRRGRPALVTLRDVGLLCPLGLCMWDGPAPRACRGLGQHWREQSRFLREYHAPTATVGVFSQPARRARLLARRAWLSLERRVALRMDLVAFVSRALMDIHGRSGFRPTRAAVLPSPVEETPPLDRDGDPRFWAAFLGKPSPGKGWLEFCAMAGLLRGEGARFVHAGPPHAPRMPNVAHAGFLSRPALASLLSGVSAVVVPSRTPDALPRAALEAQAWGVPVVASDAGGLPEIVDDGETGFVVPRGDVGALMNRIRWLRSFHGSAAQPMGRLARARALDRFGLRRVAEAHSAVYAHVMEER